MNLNQVTLAVYNMPDAVAFYQKMGFELIVDTPHYTRFHCTDGDATFSLSLSDKQRSNPTVIYFENAQLDKLVDELIAKGFEFAQLPTDMSFLWREAILFDPSGNKIKLYWAGENRVDPPWRVKQE